MKNRFSLNGDGKVPAPESQEEAVVKALNERYDELNKLWEAAEKRLKRIPIPVDAYYIYKQHLYSDDPQEYRHVQYHLGFAKHYGGWRLCYRLYVEQSEDDFEWKPIAECPLDIRIEAVEYIDKVHEAVLEKARECVPKLDAAIAELRQKVAAM